MRLKFVTISGVIIAFLALAAPPTFAQNLLVNGGFQSGNFTPGWSESGGDTGVSCASYVGYTGQGSNPCFVYLGAVGTNADISQTVSDTSGEGYALSFWYNSNGTSPSDFIAEWDSDTLLSLTNPASTNGWVNYSYSVTGTGSDTVSFLAFNNPDYDALANVSVVSAVPEPGTFFLLGTALLGMLIAFGRTRQFA